MRSIIISYAVVGVFGCAELGNPPPTVEDWEDIEARRPITIAITSPAAGATVSGTIVVTGNTTGGSRVVGVEVQVDDGPLAVASGLASWSHTLDTTALSDGAHVIRARATDGRGRIHATSIAVTVHNMVAAAPRNTSPPVMTGTLIEGNYLTASTGTWEGNPTAFEYRFARCEPDLVTCQVWAPMTNNRYILESWDVGKRIALTVIARNAHGTSEAPAAATGVVAAAQTTPPPPPPPTGTGTVVWSADHEGGNLDEWSENYGGGLFNNGTHEVVASTDFARSGSRSLRARIWTNGDEPGVRAFRWLESRAHREAYYSAWFYLPARVDVGTWWQIFQFKSRTCVNCHPDPFWFIQVMNRSDGSMEPVLTWWSGLSIAGPHANESGFRTYRSSAALPVGRWFKLEVFLRQSKDFDGRIKVFLDGAQIFDQDNVRTAYPCSDCNFNSWGVSQEWSINNYGSNLSPKPTTIFVDDAAVSIGGHAP